MSFRLLSLHLCPARHDGSAGLFLGARLGGSLGASALGGESAHELGEVVTAVWAFHGCEWLGGDHVVHQLADPSVGSILLVEPVSVAADRELMRERLAGREAAIVRVMPEPIPARTERELRLKAKAAALLSADGGGQS